MDGPDHGEQRPVLVLEVSEPRMFAQVALCSPELDFAGARDVLLDGHADDLPYQLLVELDCLGPVFVDQLFQLVGRVDASFARIVRDAPACEMSEVPVRLVGLPLTRPSDPRWTYKSSELAVLRGLTAEALGELLAEPVTVADPALWHELLSSKRHPAGERLARAMFATGALAPVTPALAAELYPQCHALTARLGRDAARAVTRHLARTLRAPANPVEDKTMDALEADGVPRAMAHELAYAANRRRAATLLLSGQNHALCPHFSVRGPHGAVQIATQTLERA
jgi:hypothetical protein